MREILSNIADWMDALKKWGGMAGHTTLQSLKGSLESTGRSATQMGICAGAALGAIGLLLIGITAALSGLLMIGGLAAIWAICISSAFMALIAGLTGWLFWTKARGSVKSAATTPQDAISTLPQLPRLDAFVALPTLPSFSARQETPQPRQITIITKPEPNNMNAKQIQSDIKSFTRDISSTVESFLTNNLGNTLNDALKAAWKWAQKNPVPAVILGASAGGAAILATVRSGNLKGSVRFADGHARAEVEDDGFVNRLTGVVHNTIDSLTGKARNGAAAAREVATDTARTATKTAHRVADYARDRAGDVSDWASDAADKARSAASDLKDGAENAWDKSTTYVKKNPGTAAAGLLAVGIVAGLLINASRKSS